MDSECTEKTNSGKMCTTQAQVEEQVAIEISDDEEVIDIGKLEKIPIDYICDWDREVRLKFAKFVIPDNDKILVDLMSEYIESLEQVAKLFEKWDALRVKILCHIMFFHSYISELECSWSYEYLDKMEKILTIYCNSELVGLHSLQNTGTSKKQIKERVVEMCGRISHMLTTYLDNNDEYILHVLIRLKTDVTDYYYCKYSMDTLYKYFLTKNINYSDESFCRCYILFQKWKQLRDKKEWPKLDSYLYKLTKKEPDCITKNDLLRKILMPKTSSLTDVVLKVFGSCRVVTKSYFDYIAAKRIEDMKSSIRDAKLSLNNVDDALLAMSPAASQPLEEEDEEVMGAFRELEALMAEVRVESADKGVIETEPVLVQCKVEPIDDEEEEEETYVMDNNVLAEVDFGMENVQNFVQVKIEPNTDDLIDIQPNERIIEGFLDSIKVDINVNGFVEVNECNNIVADNIVLSEVQEEIPNISAISTTNDDPLSEFSRIVEESDTSSVNLTQLNVTDFLDEMDKFTNNDKQQFIEEGKQGEEEKAKKKTSTVLCEYGLTTPPPENHIRPPPPTTTTTETETTEVCCDQYCGEEIPDIVVDGQQEMEVDFAEHDKAIDMFLENVRQQKNKNKNFNDLPEFYSDDSRNFDNGDTTIDTGQFKIQIHPNAECINEETMEEDDFCSQKLPNIIEMDNGRRKHLLEQQQQQREQQQEREHEEEEQEEEAEAEEDSPLDISGEIEDIKDLSEYYADMLQGNIRPPSRHLIKPLTPPLPVLEVAPTLLQPSSQLSVLKVAPTLHRQPPVLEVAPLYQTAQPSSPPTPPLPPPTTTTTILPILQTPNYFNIGVEKDVVVPEGILNRNGQKNHHHKKSVVIGDTETHYVEKIGTHKVPSRQKKKRMHNSDNSVSVVDILHNNHIEGDSKFSAKAYVKLTNICLPMPTNKGVTPQQKTLRIDYTSKEETNKNIANHYDSNEQLAGLPEPPRIVETKTAKKINGSLGGKRRRTSSEKRSSEMKTMCDDEPKVKRKPGKRGKVLINKQQESNPVDIKQSYLNGVHYNHYDKPYRDVFELNNDKT